MFKKDIISNSREERKKEWGEGRKEGRGGGREFRTNVLGFGYIGFSSISTT